MMCFVPDAVLYELQWHSPHQHHTANYVGVYVAGEEQASLLPPACS